MANFKHHEQMDKIIREKKLDLINYITNSFDIITNRLNNNSLSSLIADIDNFVQKDSDDFLNYRKSRISLDSSNFKLEKPTYNEDIMFIFNNNYKKENLVYYDIENNKVLESFDNLNSKIIKGFDFTYEETRYTNCGILIDNYLNILIEINQRNKRYGLYLIFNKTPFPLYTFYNTIINYIDLSIFNCSAFEKNNFIKTLYDKYIYILNNNKNINDNYNIISNVISTYHKHMNKSKGSNTRKNLNFNYYFVINYYKNFRNILEFLITTKRIVDNEDKILKLKNDNKELVNDLQLVKGKEIVLRENVKKLEKTNSILLEKNDNLFSEKDLIDKRLIKLKRSKNCYLVLFLTCTFSIISFLAFLFHEDIKKELINQEYININL